MKMKKQKLEIDNETFSNGQILFEIHICDFKNSSNL